MTTQKLTDPKIFQCEPERLEKIKSIESKLEAAVDAGLLSEEEAEESLDCLIQNQVLESYEAHVAHASNAFSLRKDGFDKAAKGESYDDFYARSTARIQRETYAAILAQRARRNFLTPSQIIKEWKEVLDQSSKNISAPKHDAPQLHEPA